MARLDDDDIAQARRLVLGLLAAIERHHLAADGALGRQLEAHLRGALLALEAVEGRPQPM